MADRTPTSVGPGAYQVREATAKLKQKPCMVKLSHPVLHDEQCYELVNNLRVFQPKYLKPRERKEFQVRMDGLRQNKLLRRLNETFIH